MRPVSRTLAAWKVARGLALSADPRQRWRQITLVLSSWIGTVAVLLGVSIVSAGLVAGAHVEARHPLTGTAPDEARLLVAWSGPVLRDGFSQVPVVWLDAVPGHEGDPAIVPPGLSELPGAGEAVLSPGLLAAGYTASDFGLADSTAGQGEGGAIGNDGLASLSEGFVYARPVEGRGIAADTTILSPGYAGTGYRFSPETALDVPTLQSGLVGTVWLLWIPGLYVVLGAARALPESLRARADVLWSQGVSRGMIRLIVAMETAVLSLIGIIGGLLTWWLLVDGRQRFPLADGVLLQGASSPPWTWVAGASLATLAMALAGAAAAQVLPATHAASAKPARLSRLVPFLLSMAIMFLSSYVVRLPVPLPGEAVMLTLFVGAILTAVSLPVALPVLSSLLAAALRATTRPAVWLAGRRISVHKHVLSRPAALVGCLVFIAGAAFAVMNGLTDTRKQFWPLGEDRTVFEVIWDQPLAGDMGLLAARAQAAGASVVPALPGPPPGLDVDPGPDGAMPPPVPLERYVSFTSCAEAATFFGIPEGEVGCDGLSGTVPESLGYAVLTSASGEGADATVSRAVLSAPRSWSQLDALKLASGLPGAAPQLLIGSQQDSRHPGLDWLAAGWAAASVLLLIGLVRSLGDRILVALRDKVDLYRAGLQQREVDRTLSYSTFLPVTMALPLGFAAALLFAQRGLGAGVTTFNVGLILMVAAAAAGLALLVIAAALAYQRRLAR